METQFERLSLALKRAGKSWDDVKSALGLTRAGIKKWRDGNFKELTSANVFALATMLECDARWLATGDAPAATPPRSAPPSAPGPSWPFRRVTLEDFSALEPEQMADLEGLVEDQIKRLRAKARPARQRKSRGA